MSMLTLSNQPTMSTMPTTTLSTMTITTLPTPTVATLAVSHPNSTSIWVGRQQAEVTTVGAGFTRTDVYSVIDDGAALWAAAYINFGDLLWIVTPQQTKLNDGQALWLATDVGYELIGEFSQDNFDDDLDLLDDEEDLLIEDDDDQGSEAQADHAEQSGGIMSNLFNFKLETDTIVATIAISFLALLGLGGVSGMFYLFEVAPKKQAAKEQQERLASVVNHKPNEISLEEALEDYGVDVTKRDICKAWNLPAAGTYNRETKTICYSDAGKFSPQTVLNQESLHALQNNVKEIKLNYFLENYPSCKDNSLSSENKKTIEENYPEAFWEKEKQAWKHHKDDRCVKAAVTYFQ